MRHPKKLPNQAVDRVQGQALLEKHYASMLAEMDYDFRAASLNCLIASYIKPGKKVLDIGCGTGGLSAALLRRGCEVVSQDISLEMISMCRLHLERSGLPHQNVRLGSVEEISEVAAFETVVALDVIEHIQDDRRALECIRRSLIGHGELILSVPACSWLYGPKDEQVGHYRRYDKAQLLNLIDEAGFQVRKVRYWNGIGVVPVWLSIKRGKRLDEGFRYAGRSRGKKMLNTALRYWLLWVENSCPTPIGLTLVVRAEVRH